MAMYDTAHVGEVMRAVRETKGLLQREVAGACGITNFYLSLMEAGKRRIPLGILSAAAEVLGVPIEVFDVDHQKPRGRAGRVRRLVAERARINKELEQLLTDMRAERQEKSDHGHETAE